MPQVNIADLTVSFAQTNVSVLAVHGISLGVDAGESVGILGEAGSGKSVTCRAVLRLLHEPPDRIAATHRMLDGVDMPQAGKRQMAQMGGSIAAIIFQDPLTAFDPVFTIGHQIFETIQLHHDTSKPKAQTEATALLARTNIKSPNAVMNS